MTFFPAVLIAAYLGGLGPGLLATSLERPGRDPTSSSEPLYSLEITSVHHAVALALFVLVGAVISGLSEALQPGPAPHRGRRAPAGRGGACAKARSGSAARSRTRL